MLARFDDVAAPVLCFVLIYAAVLAVVIWAVPPADVITFQWSALLAAVGANVGANTLFDRGRFRYGLRIPPAPLLANVIAGASLAALLVGSGDLLITTFTGTQRTTGAGFPWLLIFVLFTPAVFHEELLFRGYAFQKLAERSRPLALAVSSLFFTVLHLGNAHVTAVAILNIFLAGLLLGALYFVTRSLWFPLAAHFVWNILSGPILGHEVSGFEARSIFITIDDGPSFLTGGEFGIEGSLFMTGVELAALAVIYRRRRLLPSRANSSRHPGEI